MVILFVLNSIFYLGFKMSKNVQFNLRIPTELKALISDASKVSGRSINAEAQYRLEKSFEGQEGSYIEAIDDLQSFFDAHLRSDRLNLLSGQLNFLLSETKALIISYPKYSRVVRPWNT